MSISNITPEENLYLEPLLDIYKPPKSLYFIGNLPSTRIPSVAIIGTRKPTKYGREMAYKIAYALAEKGFIIISGLALGIDGVAHQAALDANGKTIAVLGSGLNYITPTTNRNLAKNIIEKKGAIISEYAPTRPALAHQFLERNRIVSGLADVIIVIEAAKRSGTLSTAGHALNQGREVFALPGEITSPMSEGTNNLIKQGAHILTSIDDIYEIMKFDQLKLEIPKIEISDPTEKKVYNLIKDGITDGDDIIKKLKISSSELNFALTMLELNNHIISRGGNKWSLK